MAFRLAGSLSVKMPTAPSRVCFTPAIFLSPPLCVDRLQCAMLGALRQPDPAKWNIMPDQFTNTQQIRKPAVVSKGGIVASQSRKAAEVGAEVLAAGGDCVDAVVATTFALGVLEPWMSGVGGGGAMVLYRAREDRYEVIDYGMRAPNSLRPEDYPLTGDGAASDIFPWPRVKDDRNLHGPGSIAVPGVVAGMEEAHRRHAKMPWKELLESERRARRRRPAGGLVDHADDCELGSRPAALPRERGRVSAGRPAAECAMGHQVQRALPQDTAEGDAVASRRRGSARFLPGRSGAQHRVRHQAGGGALSVEDLAGFRAHVREPLAIPYRGGKVLCDAGTHLRTDAGACVAAAAAETAARPRRTRCDSLQEYALALQSAYRERLQGHGRCRRPARARRRTSGAGLHHAFLGGRPRRQYGGGDANPAVDLRLEIRAPQSGITMNNGIMWFDPTPGAPNSLAPGKRCLTNYTPVWRRPPMAGGWRSAPPAGGVFCRR